MTLGYKCNTQYVGLTAPLIVSFGKRSYKSHSFWNNIHLASTSALLTIKTVIKIDHHWSVLSTIFPSHVEVSHFINKYNIAASNWNTTFCNEISLQIRYYSPFPNQYRFGSTFAGIFSTNVTFETQTRTGNASTFEFTVNHMAYKLVVHDGHSLDIIWSKIK